MSNQMNKLQFDAYILDPVARELRRGDEVVLSSGKAFDLLAFMAANPRRPLLKGELMTAVWPDSFVEESNLNQNVFVLRKALGPDGERLIVTLPRRGYQFTAEVVEVQPATPAALAPETTVIARAGEPAGQVIARQSRYLYEEETEERVHLLRSPLVWGALAILLALSATAGWLAWQRWQDHVGGPPVQVVLADLDGGTGDAVLDRSLTSAMRIELAQSPFVTVVSAATARRTMGEMLHKPDDPLTAAAAREVCERTASQAVLHGMVARPGGHFLLTEDATSCVDGSTLGGATAEADRKEDLPRAVEKLAAALRQSLGESRRTIARFSAPLSAARTGSIEALEDYSQAELMGQRGQLPQAIELLKQAVAIDPQFVDAYLSLSTFSANVSDRAGSRRYLEHAYELRALATEPTRLYIVARYNTDIQGDLYASLRNYQAWATTYPRSPVPWAGLLQVNHQLGHHQDALIAAQHALALNPHYLVLYYGMASEQMALGDLPAARATCDLAISRKLDGDLIHMVLLRLGHLQGDKALIAAQAAWADAHESDSTQVLVNEGLFAMDEGRLEDARTFFSRTTESLKRQGLAAVAMQFSQGQAESWAEIGEPKEAEAALALGPVNQAEPTQLLALASLGQTEKAMHLLAAQTAAEPTATLWTDLYGPLVRARIALTLNKPQEAVAGLERTRAFEGAGFDAAYMRGQAYLALNQPVQAEAEFRRILAHPGFDPASSQLPMAQLLLARALARQGRPADAKAAYGTFLGLWANANGSPALLSQVRTEYAALP